MCVFCGDTTGKIITFVEATLNKCVKILNIRAKHNLKYHDIQLPVSVNDTDGYHRQCYSSFTALMKKYRDENVTHSSTLTDLPSTSHSTLLPSNLESAVHRAADDVSPTADNFHLTTDDINSATDSFCSVIESDTKNATELRSKLKKACFFCDKERKKHKGTQQPLHLTNHENIYQKVSGWATTLKDDNLLQKINCIESTGETISYHHLCRITYENKYNKSIADHPPTSWHLTRQIHKSIFDNVKILIEEDIIKDKKCIFLSSICDIYNNELQKELKVASLSATKFITMQHLEEKILKDFKKEIKIECKHEKKIVLHKNCSLIDENQFTDLVEHDRIDEVALILRNTILNINKRNLPLLSTTENLIDSECLIPEKLKRFFKVMIGGNDIRRRDDTNCDRLSNSMASDAIFCVSNGNVQPSKHITLGKTVKSLTSNRKIIDILNRFGHCCNYSTLEQLETERTISAVKHSHSCSADIRFDPSLGTGFTFDNFDRYIDALTEKGTLHDTVELIYPNIDKHASNEFNIDNRSVDFDGISPVPTKRRRTFEPIISDQIPSSIFDILIQENQFMDDTNIAPGTNEDNYIYDNYNDDISDDDEVLDNA